MMSEGVLIVLAPREDGLGEILAVGVADTESLGCLNSSLLHRCPCALLEKKTTNREGGRR